MSFAILRSALLCLRGSRTPRRRNLDVKDRDLEIEKGQAGLPYTQHLDILHYWDVHRNFLFFFSLYTVVYICSVENHWSTMKPFFNYSYTKFVLNFQFEKSLIKLLLF